MEKGKPRSINLRQQENPQRWRADRLAPAIGRVTAIANARSATRATRTRRVQSVTHIMTQ